jgi:nicotinate-nucleotide pyrophosphorylase (carboxylating)
MEDKLMDIRLNLFEPLDGQFFTAAVTAAESGVLAGAAPALNCASEMGLSVLSYLDDGAELKPGASVVSLLGTAEQIARAEEELLGLIGKPSGVATAARRFTELAAGKARIVCGAWKKVSPEIRKPLREAIAVGGAGMRLLDEPFIYLDKNYVRMFSGISEVVGRARSLNGRVVIVQIRGETGPIEEEAVVASKAGASVLMVDTGNAEDLRRVVDAARRQDFRESVKMAFGGGVTLDNLEEALAAGADIIDIGRAIIDAPILDFRLDVQGRAKITSLGKMRRQDFF